MKIISLRKLSIFVIYLLLLIPAQNTIAQSGEIDLRLMGEESNKNDADIEKDLKYFWMGHNDTSLFFLLRFANLSYNDLGRANITLRTSSGDLYLISAEMNGSSYKLYIAESSSLTGDTIIPDSSTYMVQYISQQIFINPALHEFGFFIDWDDINSEVSGVEVVAWSDRPVNPGYDRIPDSGTLNYNTSDTSIDRILNYDSAIAGSYETEDPLETQEDSTPPNETTKETISYITTSRDGFSFSFISIIVGLILITFMGFLSYSWLSGSSKSIKTGKKGPEFGQRTKSTPTQQLQVPVNNDISLKYIPELDIEVRTCCYQTARLDETYCYCGRAVPKELRDLLNRPDDI